MLATEMQPVAIDYRETDEPSYDRSSADEREPAFRAGYKPETGQYVYQDVENDNLLRNAITTYLSEIGEVPLLTATEEVELAEQIVRGKAARTRLELDEPLTPQQRAALSVRVWILRPFDGPSVQLVSPLAAKSGLRICHCTHSWRTGTGARLVRRGPSYAQVEHVQRFHRRDGSPRRERICGARPRDRSRWKCGRSAHGRDR